jgi:hypothetical protein
VGGSYSAEEFRSEFLKNNINILMLYPSIVVAKWPWYI